MSAPIFDEAVYARLIRELGTEFPSDYIKFIRDFDGVISARCDFVVVPGDWGSGIYELYTMQSEAPYESLLRGLNWDGITLKPGLFPIGSDGCFGFILLSLRPHDFGSVHFCCTWSNEGKVDYYDSQAYWRIANSFEYFLASLTEPPPDSYESPNSEAEKQPIYGEIDPFTEKLILELFRTGISLIGLNPNDSEFDVNELWVAWTNRLEQMYRESPANPLNNEEDLLFSTAMATVLGQVIVSVHGWIWKKHGETMEVVSRDQKLALCPFHEFERLRSL